MKKRYNPAQDILTAIAALDQGETIVAHFRDGREATYNKYMLELLASDPLTEWIASAETGELYYY